MVVEEVRLLVDKVDLLPLLPLALVMPKMVDYSMVVITMCVKEIIIT
jgi:hypothetical protein